MNIIEGFDPTAFERMSGERIHLLVEAKKLAFADRNLHAGDPKYVSWPLETLISKAHAERRRAEIDVGRAGWPDGAQVAEHGGDTRAAVSVWIQTTPMYSVRDVARCIP